MTWFFTPIHIEEDHKSSCDSMIDFTTTANRSSTATGLPPNFQPLHLPHDGVWMDQVWQGNRWWALHFLMKTPAKRNCPLELRFANFRLLFWRELSWKRSPSTLCSRLWQKNLHERSQRPVTAESHVDMSSHAHSHFFNNQNDEPHFMDTVNAAFRTDRKTFVDGWLADVGQEALSSRLLPVMTISVIPYWYNTVDRSVY